VYNRALTSAEILNVHQTIMSTIKLPITSLKVTGCKNIPEINGIYTLQTSEPYITQKTVWKNENGYYIYNIFKNYLNSYETPWWFITNNLDCQQTYQVEYFSKNLISEYSDYNDIDP
jgi:hypothetical protein